MYHINTNKPELKVKVDNEAVNELVRGINLESGITKEKLINAICKEITNIYLFDIFDIHKLETIEIKYPSRPEGYRTIMVMRFNDIGDKKTSKPFHVKYLYKEPRHIVLKVSSEMINNEIIVKVSV